MKNFLITTFLICVIIVTEAQPFNEFSLGFDPQKGDIAVADVDNDGDFDIVINGLSNNDIRSQYYINDGNGNFSIASSNIINPGFLADIKFDDLNGDDNIDVIFTGHSGGGSSAISKAIAFNNGTGDFTISSLEVPEIAPSCGFADFNNDGYTDYYVFGNGDGVCSIFFQNYDGSFTRDMSSFTGFNFIDPEVTTLDFDNDGDIDLFVNAWNVQNETRFTEVLLNNGNGVFEIDNTQTNIIPKSYGSATWADVNGDGWLDLLFNGDGGPQGENISNVVRLYKNNNGKLEIANTFELFRQAGVGDGGKFADIDNDGDFDVIIAGWSDNRARQATVIFKCIDPENFTFEENMSWGAEQLPGVSEQSIEVADLNRDGKIDIMLMGYSDSNIGANTFGWIRNIAGYTLNNTAIVNTKPSAPTNLKQIVDNGMVSFSWDPANDNETTSPSISYQFCLRDKMSGRWLIAPNAFTNGNNNGMRKVTGMGNVSLNTSWVIKDLPVGTYEWSVQAIDASYEGSEFPELKEFQIEAITKANNISDKENPIVVYYRNDRLVVNLNQNIDNASIKIFDITGRQIYSSKLNNSSTSLKLNNIPEIIITQITNKGKITTNKVLSKNRY